MDRWKAEEFLPREASRAQWQAYHEFRRIRHDEFDPSEPYVEDGPTEETMKREEPFYFERRFVVGDGGRIVGMAYGSVPKPDSPEYESGKHIMWAGGGVVAAARRKGVGHALLERLASLSREYGTRVLTFYSEESDGIAALEHVGAEIKQLERRSRLEFDRVDWDMVARWVSGLGDRSPSTALEMYADRIPLEFLDEYCAARTELMNLMPWDDLEHGDIVIVPQDFEEMYARLAFTQSEHHTLLSREADGRITGITDVAWRPSAPEKVAQWFTGVHPDARGRGVGKALKAQMLLFLRERYPQVRWMSTENASSNGPMLAINTALGFREHRIGRSMQISREALERYLAP
jgi:GNAT superfamily N-acetyltransferase